eukprot:Skav200965  [mRNA]  locus=scaffold448:544134:548603:- [translate_table: standard]
MREVVSSRWLSCDDRHTMIGFLGLDRFYLGEVNAGALSAGTLKLATLGGFGVWWLWDIMWIGSAPIYTRLWW